MFRKKAVGGKGVLSIQGLTKHFRFGFFLKRRVAVSDVSLEIYPDEVVALLGPNGCGREVEGLTSRQNDDVEHGDGKASADGRECARRPDACPNKVV